MRFSLFVSILFHGIVLLTFQKAFPVHWFGEELRMYRVELIRPPVENLKINDLPETAVSQDRDRSGNEQEQETISLDTRDKKYMSYAGMIKERLLRHWRYPVEAKENLIEGKLTALFTIDREGHMTRVEILNSSGFEILDKEATRAIGAAAPFPSFPQQITVRRLNVKVSFDYRLSSRT